MHKILHEFTVSSPVFPNDNMVVHRVRKSELASVALKLLIEHSLSSVPVVDPDDHGKPVALFCTRDVVAYVVNHLDPHQTASPRARDFDHFFLADAKFKAFTALEFVTYCRTHYHMPPAVAMPSDLPLRAACKLVAEKKAFDVLVFDREKHHHLVNVVAASRIVEFLTAAIDSLPIAKFPIGDFDGGLAKQKQFVGVFEDAKVLSAFEQMIAKQATVCGVLDGKQKLSGAIALADIKAIGSDMAYFRALNETVTDYLKIVDDSRGHGPNRTPRPKVVTASAGDALKDVLALFSFYKVHNVFIVDNEDKPVGVVDVLDVVRWILHETKQSDE